MQAANRDLQLAMGFVEGDVSDLQLRWRFFGDEQWQLMQLEQDDDSEERHQVSGGGGKGRSGSGSR